MRKNVTIFIAILFTVITLQSQAQEFTKFQDVDYRGEWQNLPPEKTEVIGQQRCWFTVPEGIRLGAYGGSGKLHDFTDNSVVYTPSSVWGTFEYKLTFDKMPEPVPATEGEIKLPNLVKPDNFSWADLQKIVQENPKKKILWGFKVTEIIELGKTFKGTAGLAGEEWPVTIETVKSEFKNPDTQPDLMDQRYGPNAKHVFDVYYPDERGDEPLPVIMFIHGGGWGAFNKNGAQKMVKSVTEHGYALIAISYRYISEADQAPGKMVPPVTAPLYDAARAIQHIRYHAKELGIDPDRIGLTGGSAGGCSSIWLALHDDLANPDAEDPISRMSTKPQCAVPVQAQTSLDPIQVREWVPEMSYGGHAFLSSKELGNKDERYANWLAKRPEILDWIKEFSPYEHASADDPPMFFHNVGRKNVPEENATHHPKHTEMLAKRLNELGAKAWFWAQNQDSREPRYKKLH